MAHALHLPQVLRPGGGVHPPEAQAELHDRSSPGAARSAHRRPIGGFVRSSRTHSACLSEYPASGSSGAPACGRPDHAARCRGTGRGQCRRSGVCPHPAGGIRLPKAPSSSWYWPGSVVIHRPRPRLRCDPVRGGSAPSPGRTDGVPGARGAPRRALQRGRIRKPGPRSPQDRIPTATTPAGRWAPGCASSSTRSATAVAAAEKIRSAGGHAVVARRGRHAPVHPAVGHLRGRRRDRVAARAAPRPGRPQRGGQRRSRG